MECVVYMGTEDMERQRLNVFRMRLLGAEVVGVNSGTRTLKDAINEAMPTGSRTFARRTICSAPSWERTRIPAWCAIFTA